MENKKLKIGIIGLGTVGCGVVKVLEKFNDIEIALASVKNLNKKRDVEVKNLTSDSMQIATNPDIGVNTKHITKVVQNDPLIRSAHLANAKQRPK